MYLVYPERSVIRAKKQWCVRECSYTYPASPPTKPTMNTQFLLRINNALGGRWGNRNAFIKSGTVSSNFTQ